jgi:hypothetical protein
MLLLERGVVLRKLVKSIGPQSLVSNKLGLDTSLFSYFSLIVSLSLPFFSSHLENFWRRFPNLFCLHIYIYIYLVAFTPRNMDGCTKSICTTLQNRVFGLTNSIKSICKVMISIYKPLFRSTHIRCGTS